MPQPRLAPVPRYHRRAADSQRPVFPPIGELARNLRLIVRSRSIIINSTRKSDREDKKLFGDLGPNKPRLWISKSLKHNTHLVTRRREPKEVRRLMLAQGRRVLATTPDHLHDSSSVRRRNDKIVRWLGCLCGAKQLPLADANAYLPIHDSKISMSSLSAHPCGLASSEVQ